MKDWPIFVIAVVGLSIGACSGPTPASPRVPSVSTADFSSGTQSTTRYKTAIPFAEAEPLLRAHNPELHARFASQPPGGLATAWAGWIAERDGDIRKRLERGDEDSILNLWYFGTSFTTLPRATERDLAAAGANAGRLLEGRLNDLLQAAATPRDNERLQLVQQVMARHGIDLSSEAGQEQAWKIFVEIKERIAQENRTFRERAAAARNGNANTTMSALAMLYRDRGLSSDTSLAADFALDRALGEMKASRRLGDGQVHRMAIVGPGLDFTDKTEGYDFYPLQTIQPFAVIDSLVRSKLAAPDLMVTTLDVSGRVNGHLSTARQHAQSGAGYTLQLPLEANGTDRHWNPELEKYWEQMGSSIGEAAAPIPPPQELAAVRVRAVEVRPSLVATVTPLDLNIVLERVSPESAQPFDLIIATNVLVYYDPLDQALALSNIASMLKPGGYFMTNYAVSPPPSFDAPRVQSSSVYFDRQQNGDTILVYRRK